MLPQRQQLLQPPLQLLHSYKPASSNGSSGSSNRSHHNSSSSMHRAMHCRHSSSSSLPGLSHCIGKPGPPQWPHRLSRRSQHPPCRNLPHPSHSWHQQSGSSRQRPRRCSGPNKPTDLHTQPRSLALLPLLLHPHRVAAARQVLLLLPGARLQPFLAVASEQWSRMVPPLQGTLLLCPLNWGGWGGAGHPLSRPQAGLVRVLATQGQQLQQPPPGDPLGDSSSSRGVLHPPLAQHHLFTTTTTLSSRPSPGPDLDPDPGPGPGQDLTGGPLTCPAPCLGH